jgi:hypothetical protein
MKFRELTKLHRKSGVWGTRRCLRIGVGKHLQGRPLNRRSLHYAPPDFLSRLVALIIFMRFPLRETAPVALASAAK